MGLDKKLIAAAKPPPEEQLARRAAVRTTDRLCIRRVQHISGIGRCPINCVEGHFTEIVTFSISPLNLNGGL